MKLPFSKVIGPILKPYLGDSRMFCQNPTFGVSLLYTSFYGILGFFINANHLRRHFGETPWNSPLPADNSRHEIDNNFMLIHDLKIIATSMGMIQYACLFIGCVTENPALFLPHLVGQLIIVLVKTLNMLLLVAHVNLKSMGKVKHKLAAIMLMTFNWCQEFCVFRRFLCICDL